MGIEKPVFVSQENTLLYKNLIQMELVKQMYSDTSNANFLKFVDAYSKKFTEIYNKKLEENPSLLQNYATDPEFKRIFLLEMKNLLEEDVPRKDRSENASTA